jgi:hypothetical protein
MAVVAKDIFLEVQERGGGTPSVVSFAEGATQTFKKGWVVILSAGFVVDPASDTPAAILGVAAEDAHNDTVAGTHTIGVYLAIPTNVFAGNVLQSSLADHVLVQGDIGTSMAIQRDTVNFRWFLNASTVGGANIRVFTYEIAQNQSATPNTASGPFGVGDTNVRLTFTFLPNWSASLGTS